jgi:hypothetical protein
MAFVWVRDEPSVLLNFLHRRVKRRFGDVSVSSGRRTSEKAIDTKLIDQLLAEHGHRPEASPGNWAAEATDQGDGGTGMHAEMTGHLGYQNHDPSPTIG